MSILELIIIALGLSMDAFAIAVSAGLTMPKATFKKAAIVGLYFGIFQALMPVIGYFLATWFSDKIVAFDHWIAFVLLSIIGGKMIFEVFAKKGCRDRKCPSEKCADRECPRDKEPENKEFSLMPSKMLPLAVATSIDALAVGVSFALINTKIVPAVISIGVITFALAMAGVKIGNIFGAKLKSKAEFIGGVILILMGVKILLEHMGVINF